MYLRLWNNFLQNRLTLFVAYLYLKMVDAVSKILKRDGGSNPTYRFMLKNNSTTLGSNGIPARDPMYSIAFFVSFVGNIEFFTVKISCFSCLVS